MVVEKLIKKSEKYVFNMNIPNFNRSIPESRFVYRRSEVCAEFSAEYEYWYDGRLLLVGSYPGEGLSLVESETGFYAVRSTEFLKKPKVSDLIDKFKEKLAKSGRTIHEVIRRCKDGNLDLETWLISLLII